MSWIDAVGHLGYMLLFFGVVLVGRKLPVGWLLYVVGDLIWLALGWELGLTSIMLWQVAFLLQAIINWRRWRKDAKKVNAWTQWTSPRESSSSSSTPASEASGT